MTGVDWVEGVGRGASSPRLGLGTCHLCPALMRLVYVVRALVASGPAWLLLEALERAVRTMSSLVDCRVGRSTPVSAGFELGWCEVGFGFAPSLWLGLELVWSSVRVTPLLEVGLE